MATQPRVTITQVLDGMTPSWDDLVRRAGLPNSPAEHHQLEHDAQIFADRLVAAFRGHAARRPSCEPLHIDAKTGRCMW